VHGGSDILLDLLFIRWLFRRRLITIPLERVLIEDNDGKNIKNEDDIYYYI